MPRPGPRPYECVRRAWHSERHQQIRASLIQEIFRVADEIHSPATKRNKEWQRKLPDVVLQAERIMYSKANSEAEYMDPKTLWDRTNDAINIIIRRDESTETGQFLQPCIEAALFLGCTPRRASRSQRNCNPRFYLSPIASEVTSVSPSIVENAAQADYTIPPQYVSQAPNFVKPSSHLSSEHRNPFIQSSDRIVMTSQNVSPMCNYDQLLTMKNYAANNSYSSYPLYYGNRSFGLLPQPVSEVLEPAKGCVPPNLSGNEDASKKNTQSGIRDGVENPCKIGCDLSLRLGPVCPNAKEWQPKDVKNVGSQEGGDICDQSPQSDRQFSFFPKPCSINGNSKSAFKNVEPTMRKRKAAFDHPAEEPQFCLQPKLPLSHLTGSLRNTGS